MPEAAVSILRGSLPRMCHFCGEGLRDDQAVCGSCGRAIVDPARRRNLRPVAREIVRIPAEGLMKEYTITQNSIDGALNCTCPSFEEQNNSDPEALPFGSCKHVRRVDREILNEAADRFSRWTAANGGRIIPPSAHQRALLEPFKTRIHERLSSNQAYHIVGSALERQGIGYPEYLAIMRQQGRASVLPKRIFAVEIENYFPRRTADGRNGQQAFIEKARELGIEIEAEGYNHQTRKRWKIVTDGSLNGGRDMEGQEVVSPPLYGAWGFEQIRLVCQALSEAGCEVNWRCGLHGHIDANCVDDGALIRMKKVWMVIERWAVWGLVPPSRRCLPCRAGGQQRQGGTYCREVTMDDLLRCVSQGPRTAFDPNGSDHYMSLGYAALRRHGSIEIRSAAGTIQSEKIRNWMVFLLKLTDSVFAGLGPEDVRSAAAIENLLDLIGMSREISTSPIIASRLWCIDRFRNTFRWHESDVHRQALANLPAFEGIGDAADGTEHREDAAGPDETGSAEGLPESVRGPFSARVLGAAFRRYRHAPMRRPLTGRDEAVPANTVGNLCAAAISSRYDRDFLEAGLGQGVWDVRSGSNPDRVHRVELRQDDTLVCSCPTFRGRRSCCTHAASVARYLHLLRECREEEERWR